MYITSVRIKVKEGKLEHYLAAVKAWASPDGMNGYLAKTGNRSFCFTGIFKDEESLNRARPLMFAHLETVKGLLEELSPELGLTDAVSGPIVYEKFSWCA